MCIRDRHISLIVRFYPKAWGHPLLREAIANYYNNEYGTTIAPENVMVFAGGRPGIFTVLAFLKKHVQVRMMVMTMVTMIVRMTMVTMIMMMEKMMATTMMMMTILSRCESARWSGPPTWTS